MGRDWRKERTRRRPPNATEREKTDVRFNNDHFRRRCKFACTDFRGVTRSLRVLGTVVSPHRHPRCSLTYLSFSKGTFPPFFLFIFVLPAVSRSRRSPERTTDPLATHASRPLTRIKHLFTLRLFLLCNTIFNVISRLFKNCVD